MAEAHLEAIGDELSGQAPVGAEYSALLVVDQGKRGRCWSAVTRILYQLIASLARLAVRFGRSKDLEIIVLRHQAGERFIAVAVEVAVGILWHRPASRPD